MMPRHRRGLLYRIWQSRNAYLFISPFYILFLAFGLFPILFTFYLSFQRWSGFDQMHFVGLRNYSVLLSDGLFWTSLGNTVYLWLGHIFILLAIALGLALLLNAPWLRLRGVYRTIVYLPNTTATAAMALVFGMIFDYHFGILNSLLNRVGLGGIDWLGSTAWSKPSIILLGLWLAVGWYMVILLAGLQSIDPVLYEAASIDGANAWRKLVHITIPSLRKILFFCFIVETISSFQIFTEAYILTQGGPENSSLTLALYLYQNGFEYLRLGYAAALSVVLFALTVTVSVAQWRLSRGEVLIQ